MLETGKFTEAEPLLTAAMHRWKRTGATAARIARSASALGEVLYRLGRPKDAEKYLVDAYKVLAADDSTNREDRIKARERVRRFYLDRGEKDKLEALMLATNEAPSPPLQSRQH